MQCDSVSTKVSYHQPHMTQLASPAKTGFGQMLENTSALKHHGQCTLKRIGY